jgi:regulation of enolase protein 1 (concanavalin A-like superfamily)
VTAAGFTDIFVHPQTGDVKLNAARALAEVPEEDWQLSAKVTVGFKNKWDAGALMVWINEGNWAKLNFELAPDGIPTVFSVVTRGRSDDAVGWTISSEHLWLRINYSQDAYYFYASEDGEEWQLVRQFYLPAGGAFVAAGIEVQSPVGEGCDVLFDELNFALLPPPPIG